MGIGRRAFIAAVYGDALEGKGLSSTKSHGFI